MADWVVVPCLKALIAEFNEVAPHRDKGADGTIGDSSHTSSSDHTPDEQSDKLRNKDADTINEVHAADIDSTGPWPDGKRGDIKGGWFDKKVHHLIELEKQKWLDPNDMCRLNYLIWFGEIFDKDNDFEPQPYTATDDPHTSHLHASARYETRAENDQRPWGIAEDDMPTAQEIAEAVFDRIYTETPLKGPDGQPDGTGTAPGPHVGWKQGLPSAKAGKRVYAYQLLGTVESEVLQIKQMVADLAGKDFTDEAAIVSGVLAGLASSQGVQEIADAILAGLPPDLAVQVVDEMGKRLSPPE